MVDGPQPLPWSDPQTPCLLTTRFEADRSHEECDHSAQAHVPGERGPSMTSRGLLDSGARGDALVCRSAVLLFRARRKAGVAGEELAPDVERLLSAVALELETDPGSIPVTLRCAAVQLAERLVQRSSIPISHHTVDDEPVELRRSNHRETSETDHRSGTPFSPSIRLGRMG